MATSRLLDSAACVLFRSGILALAACSLERPRATPPPPPPDRVAIVASERGPTGARLVAIDERGDRRFVVVAPPTTPGIVRDTHPVISPDGRWLVFASSRERASLAETSLWIAPVGAGGVARRLTDDARAIDSHPTWTRDGRAIVFASTRARGDFDLWRLAIEPGGRPGALIALTSAAGHEVTPTVAADGTVIYAAVSADGATSRLEARAPDGMIAAITDGPADTTPALSPDERTIAFARAVEHASGRDGDLFVVSRAGGEAARLVDLPLTDEGGPVWSPDGRYVFATSVLRGEGGSTLFAAIVFVDRAEPHAIARVLEDRAGPIARLTPAIARTPLDAAALHRVPEYLPELSRIVAAAIAREQRAHEQEPR